MKKFLFPTLLMLGSLGAGCAAFYASLPAAGGAAAGALVGGPVGAAIGGAVGGGFGAKDQLDKIEAETTVKYVTLPTYIPVEKNLPPGSVILHNVKWTVIWGLIGIVGLAILANWLPWFPEIFMRNGGRRGMDD